MVEPLAAMASWATPTSLFVLVNVVIGVIAIISVYASRNNDHPPPPRHRESTGRLVRAPSLFSRVTSFNFSKISYDCYSYESSAVDQAHPYAVSPPENPPPSILSRMTSFNGFSLCRSAEPENPPAIEEKQPPQSLLSRMASFNRFTRSAEPENPPVTDPKQAAVSRAPSLLSRMASINFSLHRSPEQEPVEEAREQHVTRSATEPKKKKKSSSEKSGKGEETASFGWAYEVDAKADDFINRFKRELRLQRLDSLLRYRNSAVATE